MAGLALSGCFACCGCYAAAAWTERMGRWRRKKHGGGGGGNDGGGARVLPRQPGARGEGGCSDRYIELGTIEPVVGATANASPNPMLPGRAGGDGADTGTARRGASAGKPVATGVPLWYKTGARPCGTCTGTAHAWCCEPRCCAAATGVFVVLFVALTIAFWPLLPAYNVCATEFQWGSIVTGLVRRGGIGGDEKILISVRNPNRFGMQVREACAMGLSPP